MEPRSEPAAARPGQRACRLTTRSGSTCVLLLLVWVLPRSRQPRGGGVRGSVLSLTLGVLALGTGGFGFWCLIRSMGGEQR